VATPHNYPKERCPKSPNLFLRAPLWSLTMILGVLGCIDFTMSLSKKSDVAYPYWLV